MMMIRVIVMVRVEVEAEANGPTSSTWPQSRSYDVSKDGYTFQPNW